MTFTDASTSPFHRSRRIGAVAALASALLALNACGSGGSDADTPAGAATKLDLAFFAFSTNNTYQVPLVAEARAAAAANNANLTVLDANNDPKTQFAQIQDAIATGRYDGFVLDPIDGAGLVPIAKRAIAAKIKVVSVDTAVGTDLTSNEPQVEGLSASVGYPPGTRGMNAGELVKQACAQIQGECNVGYMYSFKASSFDKGVRTGFDGAIKGDPKITVVAEGEDQFTPATGASSTQTMLQAHPEINVMVGADQGMSGATQALTAAGKLKNVKIVGVGGSVAGLKFVADGTWFGSVPVPPGTMGKMSVEALVKAIRDGADPGAVDPTKELPGVIATQENVGQFTGQWKG